MDSVQSIKDRIPDYAKDLRLNFDAVLNRSSLTPAQARAAALAAAFAPGPRLSLPHCVKAASSIQRTPRPR